MQRVLSISDIALTVVAIIIVAVGIAQLAEHRTVAPAVAGSIPVSHPNSFGSLPSAVRSALASRLRSSHHGPVAQLDRASVFGTEGWGFEPLRGRHSRELRRAPLRLARCQRRDGLLGQQVFVKRSVGCTTLIRARRAARFAQRQTQGLCLTCFVTRLDGSAIAHSVRMPLPA